MHRNNDKCPICGKGSIKVQRKDEVFKYKDKTLTLELTVYICDICKEEFFDNEEMLKYQKTIKNFTNKN